MDRPEEFHYGLSIGSVSAVYPNDWEVDLLGEDGQTVQRALVIGPRLPEVSTKERPQICAFGFIGHLQGRPVCQPIESRLPGERSKRSDVVYYDEFLNFRITATRDGVLEVRNSKGSLLQHRIIEQDGVIRSDTPTTHIIQTDGSGKVEIHCDGDAEIVAGGNVKVQAKGNVTVDAGASITAKAATVATIEAPAISLKGNVTVTGNVDVTGNINATGQIIDVGGNTPNHHHG